MLRHDCHRTAPSRSTAPSAYAPGMDSYRRRSDSPRRCHPAPLGRRGQRRRFRGWGEFPELFPQLRAVRMFNPGEVPIDREPIARLLGRPELVGNNRDSRPLADGWGSERYPVTPGNASCRLVVERLLTRAPKTGGRATSATFMPARSRSSPNFCEPSHLGRLSRRGHLLSDETEICRSS